MLITTVFHIFILSDVEKEKNYNFPFLIFLRFPHIYFSASAKMNSQHTQTVIFVLFLTIYAMDYVK